MESLKERLPSELDRGANPKFLLFGTKTNIRKSSAEQKGRVLIKQMNRKGEAKGFLKCKEENIL